MRQITEEIRVKSLKARRKELGRVGMIRFLQQFETDNGIYARERQASVDRTSLNQIHARPPARTNAKS
jgi:hypothetical protein